MEPTTTCSADFVPYPIDNSRLCPTETVPPSPPPRAIDERFPHLIRKLFDPTINVNGHIPFLPTFESPQQIRRERLKKKRIQTNFENVWCRHLVTHHWINYNLNNGNHAPLDLFTSQYPIWWQMPNKGDVLDMNISHFASKAHSLPAHLLRKFLAQEFQTMIEEVETSQDDRPRSRFYAVLTHTHDMGLQLLLTRKAEGKWAFHVSLYDPNTSFYAVECKPEKLEDLTTFQNQYHLLSFLISESDNPETIKFKKSYFFPQDTDRHIAITQLFEINQNPAKEGDTQPINQWTTNWCTNSHMELEMSIKMRFPNLSQEILLKVLPENNSASSWESLQAIYKHRNSYLGNAMCAGSMRAMERWERIWTKQSEGDRVLGLCGLNMDGQHVLDIFHRVSLECQQKWLEMARQLSPDLLRRLIAGEGLLANPPLICALSQGENDSTLLSSLLSLIAQAAEGQAEHTAKLLQAHDHKGRSALEFSLRKGSSDLRAAWMDELKKLPRADMAQVLAGVHRDGTPLWARLLQALDLSTMTELSSLYSKLGLTATDLEPYVALPDLTPMAQWRWARAIRRQYLFQGSFDQIKPFLPAPIQDQVAQWLTNACLQPLIVDPKGYSPYALRSPLPSTGGAATPASALPEFDIAGPYMAIPPSQAQAKANANAVGCIPFLLAFAMRPAQVSHRLKKNPIKWSDAWMQSQHLALRYCEESMTIGSANLPLQMFHGKTGIWWKSPRAGDDVCGNLPLFSTQMHALPADLMGKFLLQEFRAMQDECEAGPDNRLQTRARVYIVPTHVHFMSLELRLTGNSPDRWEYLVTVYDPNKTFYKVVCTPKSLEHIANNPNTYHLLSFLIGENMHEEYIESIMAYFHPQDKDHHIAICQLNVNSDGLAAETGPEPITRWTTNWCTNTAAELMLSNRCTLKDSAIEGLLKVLPEDENAECWESLHPLPSHDSSPLFLAMVLGVMPAIERWERLWAQQGDNARVLGLCALDQQHWHVLASADAVPEACLAKWFDMAGQLKPALQRRVIADTPFARTPPLICALIQKKPLSLTLLLRLIEQAAEGLPELAAELLQAYDHKGRAALEVSLRFGSAPVKALWLDALKKLPRADMAQVLAGVHLNGTPLWARLLQALDLGAMKDLATVYGDVGLTASDLEPHMALPDNTPSARNRWAEAIEYPDRFQATFAEIQPFLPDAIVQQVQQMLTNAAGQVAG